MEVKAEIIKVEKFDYRDSAVKIQNLPIRNAKRKRLFCEYTEAASSDNESGNIEKKVMIIKQPINFSMEILKNFQSKEYEKCLTQIDDFFKLSPDDPQMKADAQTQIRLIQAACWTMLDVNQEQTFRSLTKILEQQPENSFAFYAYGLAQYRNGELAASMSSFGKAIDLNPTNAMKRGLEYKAKAKNFIDIINDADEQFKTNNCSRSIDMLNAAVLIDPENPKMVKNITEIRDKYVVDLVSRLESEIERDLPDKFEDIEKIIMANDFKKAEKMVKELEDAEPTAKTLFVKGLLLYRKGNLKGSVTVFDEALSLDSSYEKASFMKTKAQTLLELVEKAASEMNESNFREAVRTLTKSLEIDRDNRIINQVSYFQRALANFNAGFVEAAFEDYKKFDLLKKIIGNPFPGVEALGASLVKLQNTSEGQTDDKPKKKKKKKVQKPKEECGETSTKVPKEEESSKIVDCSLEKTDTKCTKTENEQQSPVFIVELELPKITSENSSENAAESLSKCNEDEESQSAIVIRETEPLATESETLEETAVTSTTGYAITLETEATESKILEDTAESTTGCAVMLKTEAIENTHLEETADLSLKTTESDDQQFSTEVNEIFAAIINDTKANDGNETIEEAKEMAE